MFESISSFHSENDQEQSRLGDTTLIGARGPEVITVNEKIEALKTTYEDPFVEIIDMMQNDDDGEGSAYQAPSARLQIPANLVEHDPEELVRAVQEKYPPVLSSIPEDQEKHRQSAVTLN